ncbi:hypothetical protein [Macrococcus brunensis]|uniref:hypothetical protein n=1 Tax=Macrococcus brunensis TaxID=198483 RepID=UPI001EF13081|nr:hypothetical protein [Macrococcus brunensis]ULG72148.1 hypothetical protein MGG12_01075 [Macrococcus brunensis]
MKSSFRILFLVLGIIALMREAFFGLPIIGDLYVLFTAWAPIGTSLIIYGLMIAAMLADQYGRSKELLWVPIVGIVFSLISFVPIVAMILHWVMTFIMIYFIIRVMSFPKQVGNTHVYYGGDTDKTVNRRYE